jgi:hypothetical protein
MGPFFADNSSLAREVLRPLSHICDNWELTWDDDQQRYTEEPESFAKKLNKLITELDTTNPPSRYHDNEDCLAEYVRDNLKWKIHKEGRRWIGEDYDAILEQGGFNDLDEENLILAAAGRIRAACAYGQKHYDEMEDSHRKMLAAVLSVILYHRAD